MTTDIFVKSYPSDFCWLDYSLRSIQRFATGFRHVIVCVPPGHGLKLTRELIVEIPEQQPGYLFQQSAKLNADHHSTADYILHIDSDTIFTRPVTPDYFFVNGKPRWVMTPFDETAEDDKKAWLHVMVKCLREMPPFEFMRLGAHICPRESYAGFREIFPRIHKLTMDQYVMNQPGHEFSEFNCLGFFNWLYRRDKFHWHNTATDGVPEWPIKQFWSWGGLTQEIRNELEIALA
jgi:hypothetical protein